MLRNLRCEDDEQKTAADTQKKLCLKGMNQSTTEDWDKENKGHGQLKIQELAHRKKIQNRLVSLREIFALFSRIHFVCLSKIHTLFLAFRLYEKATSNPTLSHIPQTYKQLCCMFLAMKYEEIYHVDLRELASYFRVNYNLTDYCRYEKAIILAFGGNLHVVTADRILEAQFQEGQYTKTEEFLSFYLLELCYTSARVYGIFKDQEICKAICKIVKNSQPEEPEKIKDSSIGSIAKLILSAKNNMKRLEQRVFQKYQSDKYEKVSNMLI